jgi:hypothetical protein
VSECVVDSGIVAEVEMEGVSVVAVRPKIRMEKGRYIADIENSLAAIGNTIETLLNQLPGVWATDSYISLNGKAVTVYINHVHIKLEGEQLVKYLKTLRSEDVKKIEVMQQATAEFSAEGEGGVIRIITKRGVEKGWQGTISATTFSFISRETETLGVYPYLSLQYNKGKFSSRLAVEVHKMDGGLLFGEEYSQDKDVKYSSVTPDTIYDKDYSTSLTLSYDFNPFHKLAVDANYNHFTKDEHLGGTTDITGAAIAQTKSYHTSAHRTYNYSFALNYDWLLDTLSNRKITLLADYVNQYKNSLQDYFHYINHSSSEEPESPSEEFLMNNQNRPYQLYSTELRYKHNFGEVGEGLAGVKYSYSTVENNYFHQEKKTRDSDWEVLPGSNYALRYGERLTAAFYRYDLTRESWSIMAGLRGEYTDVKFDLFPSFNYSYKVNEKHDLSLSYSRRIRRISYFTLMAYRWYDSRYTIREGNPDLKPNILNTLKFNYGFLGRYYLSLNCTWSYNAVSKYNKTEKIESDNRLVIISTLKDSVKTQSYNLNAYIPISLASWWSTTNQVDIYVNSYQTPKPESEAFSNFNYSLFTQHDFLFPLKIVGQVLYKYNSKSKNAYTTNYPFHLLNVSLQRAFLKEDKLKLALSANQLIFNKNGDETTTKDARVQHYVYIKYPILQLTLSYTLSGGKTKSMQEIRNSNEQERNRAN